MSKFKVLIIVGVAVGVLGGGLIAFFMNGGKSHPASPSDVAAVAPPGGSGASDSSRRAEADSLNDKGKNLMFDGKFGEAEPMFRGAFGIVSDPRYVFNLATVLFQQGKFDEAIGAIDQLRALNLTSELREKGEKLFRKIVAERDQQRIPVAIGPASNPPAATSSRPAVAPQAPVSVLAPEMLERAAALNDQAKNLMFGGKYEEAEPLFRQAVKLVPEPKYLFNLALDLFQEGKFDEAIASLEQHRRQKLPPAERTKGEKLLGRVVAECKAQKIACTSVTASETQSIEESDKKTQPH